MFNKIILFILLLGVALFAIPSYSANYKRIEPIKTEVVKKVAVKKTVKRIYKAPEGKALEIAEYVARETSMPVELISKIMWAESQYGLNAKHINNNGSYDSGLFQINSQHITLAKSMGIDIFTPEGNADFAIYLIRKNGLRDWGYSKSTWSML